jgi:hypothetical protein
MTIWLKLTQQKGLGAQRPVHVLVNPDNIVRVVEAQKARGEDTYTKIVFVGGEVISVSESVGKIEALMDGTLETAWSEIEPEE